MSKEISFNVNSPEGIDFYPTKCRVIVNYDTEIANPDDPDEVVPMVNLTVELVQDLPRGTITQLTTGNYPREWKNIITGLELNGDGYTYDPDLLSAALEAQGLELA